MATKQETLDDQQSCLNTAQPDEPIFVLKGGHFLSHIIVRAWALEYRHRHIMGGSFTPEREVKYKDAIVVADHMEAWRAQQ